MASTSLCGRGITWQDFTSPTTLFWPPSCAAGIYGCFNRADIAANHDGNRAVKSNFFAAPPLYVGGFNYCIGGFNGADQPFVSKPVPVRYSYCRSPVTSMEILSKGSLDQRQKASYYRCCKLGLTVLMMHQRKSGADAGKFLVTHDQRVSIAGTPTWRAARRPPCAVNVYLQPRDAEAERMPSFDTQHFSCQRPAQSLINGNDDGRGAVITVHMQIPVPERIRPVATAVSGPSLPRIFRPATGAVVRQRIGRPAAELSNQRFEPPTRKHHERNISECCRHRPLTQRAQGVGDKDAFLALRRMARTFQR